MACPRAAQRAYALVLGAGSGYPLRAVACYGSTLLSLTHCHPYQIFSPFTVHLKMDFTLAEKQVLSALSFFRSRYALFLGLALDRAADAENLNDFGKAWMGSFKLDWKQALADLCQKGALIFEGGQYALSPAGEQICAQLHRESPFFQYEYDAYFQMAQRSEAHSEFCRRVYGEDLCQHGMIDGAELAVLLDLLRREQPQNILDCGCGNGKISTHIAQNLQISTLGIDISPIGVEQAQAENAQNALLSFAVGNLNELGKIGQKFGAVLFLDTLYYADNLAQTLADARDLLEEGGKIYAYFSQWIMDAAYSERLRADAGALAQAAKTLEMPYTFIDLSESGKRHWQRKWQTLEDMREDFEREGSQALWAYRYNEAKRYAHWGDDKYARYLFAIG